MRRARRTVELWALSEQRFRVSAPRHEREIAGHHAALQAAEELAERLG
jgi:hypothetical protein